MVENLSVARETKDIYGVKNIFVVLPTEVGKSLIYATLPLSYDSLLATDRSTIVVYFSFDHYNSCKTSIPSTLQPQDLMIFIVYYITLGSGYITILHKSHTGMTPDPSSLVKGLACQTVTLHESTPC